MADAVAASMGLSSSTEGPSASPRWEEGKGEDGLRKDTFGEVSLQPCTYCHCNPAIGHAASRDVGTIHEPSFTTCCHPSSSLPPLLPSSPLQSSQGRHCEGPGSCDGPRHEGTEGLPAPPGNNLLRHVSDGGGGGNNLLRALARALQWCSSNSSSRGSEGPHSPTPPCS